MCGGMVPLFAGALSGLVVAGGALGDGPLSFVDSAAVVGLSGGYMPSAQIGSSWMAGGGAVGDFNNNGLPDLFLLTAGSTLPPDAVPAPDRLYINQGDGTFIDEAAEWGLTQIHSGNAAAVGDFNSNGYLDVFVTSFGNLEDGGLTPGRNKLYRNDGGTFVNVAEQAGVEWVHPTNPAGFGACWGDYNLNGHLDLFVAVYWPAGPQPQVLFRNNGDGTFTNVSQQAGVHHSIWGFQGVFVDMNENGWPDLLVAADFKTSRYYRNNGNGTFTNLAAHPTVQSDPAWPGNGTGHDANGMGHAIADVNNNGLLDWYVTSIYPSVHAPYDGNMLYLNQGDHQFDEVAKQVGAHDGAWGWGTVAVDLDNNGCVDLVAVNGRPVQQWSNIPPQLFYNNCDGMFTDIAVESGMTHGDQGRGIVRLDGNREGRQDIIIINWGTPWRYYQNQTPNAGNWIGIDFDTSNNPLLAPNGFGARVIVEADGKSYLRYMHGDPSYLATSELNVHFGLGAAEVIDQITIKWPRGYVTTLENVAVNQYITVNSPAPADLNADGVVNVFDLLTLLAKWGPVTSAHDLYPDLNNDGVVNVFDLLALLASWGPTG